MKTLSEYQVKRISYSAVNKTLRGNVVSIVGFQPATWFDIARIIVRLVNNDGSLGDEYLVHPSIVIDL